MKGKGVSVEEEFCRFEKDVVRELSSLDFYLAFQLGSYQVDFEDSAPGEEERRKRVSKLSEIRDELLKFDLSGLSRRADIAGKTALNYTKLRLFRITRLEKEIEPLYLPKRLYKALSFILYRPDITERKRWKLLGDKIGQIPRLFSDDASPLSPGSEGLLRRSIGEFRFLENLLSSVPGLLEGVECSRELKEEIVEKAKEASASIRDYRKGLEDTSPEVSFSPLGEEKLSRLFDLEGAGCEPFELVDMCKGVLRESREEMEHLADQMGEEGGISGSLKYVDEDYPHDRQGTIDRCRKATKKVKKYLKDRILLEFPPDEKIEVIDDVYSGGFGGPTLKYFPPPRLRGSKHGILALRAGETPREEKSWPSHWQIGLRIIEQVYPGVHMLFCRQSVDDHPFLALSGSPSVLGGWSLYSSGIMENYDFKDAPEMNFLKAKSIYDEASLAIAGTRLACGKMDYRSAVEYLADSTGKSSEAAEVELTDALFRPSRLARLWGRKLLKELKGEVEWEMGGTYSDLFFHNSVTRSGPLRFDELRELVLKEAREISCKYRGED